MSDLYLKIINPEAPIVIIAEMAWAHDGVPEKAQKIVERAAEAGADAINFHITSVEDYMVPFYGAGPGRISNKKEKLEVFQYLQNINLQFEVFKKLAQQAREQGLAVTTMCNDFKSLSYAVKEIRPDLLMIHPSCLTDLTFVQEVAKKQFPLLLYCGGLTLGEIEAAIINCKDVNNTRIILQHGFQSYPTNIEDNHLQYIKTLARVFNYPISFGDHTDADDSFALIAPLLAIPYGARVLEKHLTLDRTEKGEDYESSLNPQEFKKFVDYVRLAEKAIGASFWRPLNEREEKYRSIVRKRAIAVKEISKGELLTEEHIIYKRSDQGLFPEEVRPILNNIRMASPIEQGMPIEWNKLT